MAKKTMKTSGFFLVLSLRSVWAFSSTSSFTRTLAVPTVRRMSGNMVMYDQSKDPPSSPGDKNMWSVLANTEKWISTILGNADSSNPYTRKEVSYLCELSDEDALVVAGIWRRLRESREQGESHGQTQEQRLASLPNREGYKPATFRQTQVIVLPNDANLDNFKVFDDLVNRINGCRRNARDYVLDVNLEKLEEGQDSGKEVGERDWSVSVNCAHLHPKFGEQTKEEKLQEMIEEEENGEIDVNLQMYKKKRLLARRSPYPTLCIEVRATPPPDFSAAGPPPELLRENPQPTSEDAVTKADVQKLEALFGRSAALGHPAKDLSKKQKENAFYDSIASTGGIEEISIVSPLSAAQNWIAQNHDAFNIETSTFTRTTCRQVDEGFEYVFNNIAMQVSGMNEAGATMKATTQYLVFTKFMSSSATSFEKFGREVNGVIGLLPSLKGRVQVSTLHPEHVDETRRAPHPVLVLSWNVDT